MKFFYIVSCMLRTGPYNVDSDYIEVPEGTSEEEVIKGITEKIQKTLDPNHYRNLRVMLIPTAWD